MTTLFERLVLLVAMLLLTEQHLGRDATGVLMIALFGIDIGFRLARAGGNEQTKEESHK